MSSIGTTNKNLWDFVRKTKGRTKVRTLLLYFMCFESLPRVSLFIKNKKINIEKTLKKKRKERRKVSFTSPLRFVPLFPLLYSI